MAPNAKCSEEGPFFPATPRYLVQNGMAISQDILKTPNWLMIFMLLISVFLVLVLMVIALVSPRLVLYFCPLWKTQVPGSKLGGYGTVSTDLQTDYHITIIIKLRVRWCVWKVGQGIPDQVWPKTLKWVVVTLQCDFPHQWIAQRQVCPVSVYCDGFGCHGLCLWHGMVFLCGSTLVKVSLLFVEIYVYVFFCQNFYTIFNKLEWYLKKLFLGSFLGSL